MITDVDDAATRCNRSERALAGNPDIRPNARGVDDQADTRETRLTALQTLREIMNLGGSLLVVQRLVS